MITLYCPQVSPRIKYVFEFVFRDVLMVDYIISSDQIQIKGPVINYSKEKLNIKNFQIYPTAFLKSTDLNFSNYISYDSKENHFFEVQEGDLSFDIFSAVFFLISRMEEYNLNTYDEHQRYISENSCLVKLKLEDKPVVDNWCFELLKKVNNFFNLETKSTKKFMQYCTFDIDNAFAFKNKGLIRNTGSFIKDLFFLRSYKLKQRFQYLFGVAKDPYDNYYYISEFLKKNNLKSVFFFLLGNYGKMDKNINPKNANFKKLILSISRNNEVGIHPSYNSFNNTNLVSHEISLLKETIYKKITQSRYHYLRFSFPKSYQILNRLGVQKDYSMGYSDRVGFRAGTCTPFKFYDLENETTTDLKIVPFSYMDGVLNDHLKYSCKSSIEIVRNLKNNVKKVNGEFTSVWHNESLSNLDRWKGWREVFESTWLD